MKKKRKEVLYRIELSEMEAVSILLVKKEILDWVENGGEPPQVLVDNWDADGLTPKMALRNVFTKNDRAVAVPAARPRPFFNSQKEFQRWYNRNREKYTVKKGFYGVLIWH